MEKGITRFYGNGGLNVDKLEAEGSFDVMGVMWGFILDTEGEGSCRVPPLKLIKVAYLLADPCFDHGGRKATLLDIQRLAGTLQSLSIVLPALRPEMHAVYALMRPGCSDIDYADFWHTCEILRLIMALPER